MPFTATWSISRSISRIDLEIFILSEVRKRKTNAICYHSDVDSKIKHKWTYL